MTKLTLRDYQDECVQAHYDYFCEHDEGHPLFVVPTGGGKSLIIAEFLRRSVDTWPSSRFLVLTHVQELIRQNHAEFINHVEDELVQMSFTGASRPLAGIYSAGLGERCTDAQVVFAGIQSVYKRAAEMGHFDLVLIDEAHLVPKQGMGRYRTFLDAAREVNPNLRVCGYTATHYRLAGGYLHEGDDRMFTDVAYEVPVELLIEQGHLVPLVAKLPDHVVDTSGVKVQAGEFNLSELEEVVAAEEHVVAAVHETASRARAAGRKHWLLFATTVKHATGIAEVLGQLGVDHRVVFGHTPKEERDQAVQGFRDGEFTALVNVGVLTTGFNAPRCDLLAVMRPTQSTALYVQIMGRGMRTFPGKRDCLVLDFGDNVRRHGPINKVRPNKQGEDGEAPTRTCPQCASILPSSATRCPDCGAELPRVERKVRHAPEPGEFDPFDPSAKAAGVNVVDDWHLFPHHKEGKPPSMRVSYSCGFDNFSEWVCFEHGGGAAAMAARWWRLHGGMFPVPETARDGIRRQRELRMPATITVKQDGEYHRVVARTFGAEVEDLARG